MTKWYIEEDTKPEHEDLKLKNKCDTKNSRSVPNSLYEKFMKKIRRQDKISKKKNYLVRKSLLTAKEAFEYTNMRKIKEKKAKGKGKQKNPIETIKKADPPLANSNNNVMDQDITEEYTIRESAMEKFIEDQMNKMDKDDMDKEENNPSKKRKVQDNCKDDNKERDRLVQKNGI